MTTSRLPRGPRLRPELRSGAARVRSSWWGVLQSGLAGTTAWEVATRVVHHQAPFFAAVAAIVCLSTSFLNRLRRVAEMAIGVAIGVGLGDLLVREIGRGGWQLGLVVLIAMSTGLLLDGGALIVNQAALQAVFVTALPPPAGGYVGRWVDALIGGAVALVVAFALPADPRPALRRQAEAVGEAMTVALRQAAQAARDGDAEAAAEALDLARGTQSHLDRWRDAVRAAEEISRISPLRRHARAEIAAHRTALGPVDRAIRNVRVALRRTATAVDDDVMRQTGAGDGGRPRPALSGVLIDVLDDLGGVFATLRLALLDPRGEGGRRMRAALDLLTARLDPREVEPRSMNGTVVLAQVRSAAIDLMTAVGLPYEQARGRLPGHLE